MSQPTAPIKVRVGGILIHTFDNQPKVLLVRQNNRPFWVLPGGTLEWGETLEDCLVREIYEEVGIFAKVTGLLDVTTWLPTDEHQNVTKHVIDCFYSLAYISGPTQWIPPYPENINDIQWVSYEQISSIQIMPSGAINYLMVSFNKY